MERRLPPNGGPATSQWFSSERRRRWLQAAAIYALFTLVALLLAPRELLAAHTPYNHFALLAEAFRGGRLDLGGPPPSYAGHNDFAVYAGRHYVVFPPFPALILLPLVSLAGSAEALPDGLVFLLLAGLAPAALFLALEKLRRAGESERSWRENAALALTFAFGSVYFFCALQGTVWFAAHVVAVVLASLYLRFSIAAERPLLAGVCLALAAATRSPLWFAAPLFVFEACRRATPGDAPDPLREPAAFWRSLDRRRLLRALGVFCLPLALVAAALMIANWSRFGDPLESGYRYLAIAWRGRIERWGLFSYHYLARNLGVMLTALPWVPGSAGAPFTINHHGLALWVTTPLYFLLFRWRSRPPMRFGLVLAAVCCALPSLFYQNTGWLQFGYRFSNDYAVFLFALLAVSGTAFRHSFALLAMLSVVVNAFGAVTFGRPEYVRFYFTDPTQQILYQPD